MRLAIGFALWSFVFCVLILGPIAIVDAVREVRWRHRQAEIGENEEHG